jgi:hypothetical protein
LLGRTLIGVSSQPTNQLLNKIAAMSYIDNRVSLNLVGYDQNKKLVNQLEVPGTRYIFTLAYDPTMGGIRLIGQSSAAVTVNITQVV